MRSVVVALALSTLPLAPAAGARGWEVDPDGSVFAVVTHKAGLAKGLAHEHLVTAAAYTLEVELEARQPAAVRVRFETPAGDLLVDDSGARTRWGPTLEAKKLIVEPFATISAKDQAKIRKSMLAPDQLDAANHPTIVATLEGLTPIGDADSPLRGELSLTVRGKTAKAPVEVDWSVAESRLELEAHATFKFTALGIEPYSAALGAVKVADPFEVWVRLQARPSGEPTPAEADADGAVSPAPGGR